MIPQNFSTRLTFVIRQPFRYFKSVADRTRIAIRRFLPDRGEELLIVAVHLSGKMFLPDQDQDYLAEDLRRAITEAEARVGHQRTIVIGDFNMDPFQSGLVASHRLHAVMDRKIAIKGSRKVHGVDHPFFYNPMWSHMGDKAGRTPGTYYYERSAPVAYFWHTFDQILIRPALLDKFDEQSLCIMTSDGERRLATKDGRPDAKSASDHFPIRFRLKF